MRSFIARGVIALALTFAGALAMSQPAAAHVCSPTYTTSGKIVTFAWDCDLTPFDLRN